MASPYDIDELAVNIPLNPPDFILARKSMCYGFVNI
jgi:hypothetical protein